MVVLFIQRRLRNIFKINRNIFLLILFSSLFPAEPIYYEGIGEEFNAGEGSYRGLGQYGYPSDPMSDRAKGYLLKGKVKNGISNWGDFINWYVTPAGLWGEFSYLPDVAMIAGVPGHQYSSHYQDWSEVDMQGVDASWNDQYGDAVTVWCSEELYDDWSLNPEELNDTDTTLTIRVPGKYIGIVFETENDRGTVGERKSNITSFDGANQWIFEFANNPSRVCFTTRADDFAIAPNLSTAGLLITTSPGVNIAGTESVFPDPGTIPPVLNFILLAAILNALLFVKNLVAFFPRGAYLNVPSLQTLVL